MEFRIRPLTVNHCARLLEFYTTLSPDVTALFQPFGPHVTEDTIRRHLAETDADKHISLGLRAEDGPIAGHGFILFTETDRPVFGIGLREGVHGRGLGRRLMQAVLDEGDARGLLMITLTVLRVNTKARSLYEKMGFVVKGQATFRDANDSWYMERSRADGEMAGWRRQVPNRSLAG